MSYYVLYGQKDLSAAMVSDFETEYGFNGSSNKSVEELGIV